MKRDKVLDVARGISILLVVIGHCQFLPQTIKVLVYSFHMPMFFFISGMCFSYKKYPKFKDFFKSKAKGLLIPYFALGIVVLNLTRIYEFCSNGTSFSEFFNMDYLYQYIGMVLAYRLNRPYYYSFWFISALFTAILLFYLIVKLIDKHPKKNLICVAIIILSSAIGYVILQYIQGFVWSIDVAPVAISFLMLGYLVQNNKEMLKNKILKFDYAIFLLGINVICAFTNYKLYGITDLFSCHIGNYFLYMLQSISGIWILMIVSSKIESSNILEYCGKNTLIFYMFHYKIFFAIINDILKNYTYSKNIKLVIEITITTILLCGLSFIINKFCPFLLGKWNNKKKIKEANNA